MAPVSAPDWAEVYAAHAHHLMRLATMLVGRDDAADLVAEGVHRAMRSGSWSGVLEPRAYLTRIVVNTASDERRRRMSDRSLCARSVNITASGYALSRTCATTSLSSRQAPISASRWARPRLVSS